MTNHAGMLAGILRQHWGYDHFRPLQREAMEAHLARRDSVVILPTGGGKSLCFQAPALALDGTAIVVSPLISLMKDQVDTLRGLGIPAGKLHSGQSPEESREVGDGLRRGDLKLLYVSPERLVMEGFDRITRGARVSFLAVDEAHCISEWGHDFRKEYRQLRGFRDAFPDVSMHSYTATATPQVARDIATQLGLRDPLKLIGSFDRPNLFYRSEPRADLIPQIRRVAKRHPRESGIVYCISRKDTERIATELTDAGIPALPYHAGMDDELRARNQDRFINDEVPVIVATIAFGMGIDKPDVRFVVHAGMPKSLENYQQESGRAERDGLASECVLLHSSADLIKWRHITKDLPPDQLRVSNGKLRGVEDYATSFACRRAALLRYFGETWTHENCGGCDVCSGHPSPVPDSLVVAQKILSCVKRLREAHGAVYTTHVLRGVDDSRIAEAGHHQLSTFGLLRDVEAGVVRGWIAQLAAQGYLLADGRDGPLKVTQRGWEAIHGRANPLLHQPGAKVEEAEDAVVGGEDEWAGADRDLFEELRVLRSNLAKEHSLRPYQVFGDRTLREMAAVRPTTLARMGRLYGVGQRKLDTFGKDFLRAIASFLKRRPEIASDVDPDAPPPSPTKRPGPLPDRVKALALDQLREGASVADVAEAISRAPSTVRGYLLEMLEAENITDPTRWIPASDAVRIEVAATELGEFTRMRPIFDALHGDIAYDHISIALACLRNARRR